MDYGRSMPASPDPMGPGMMDPTDAGDGSDSLEAHSAAVMKALKAGDRRGFTTALKAFVKECYANEEDSGPDF